MRKILFASVPSIASLVYMIVEFIIYCVRGRMFFSGTFLWEWILYALAGACYLFFGFRIGRFSYLWVALFGLVIGFVIFTVIGYELFLHFEFARNLSL